MIGGGYVVIPVIGVLAILAWRARRRRVGRRALLTSALVVVYVGWLVTLAFFPLPLPPWHEAAIPSVDYRGFPYPWVSPIPLLSIGQSIGLGIEWPSVRYLIGNVVAFVPIGLLVPVARPQRHSVLMVVGVALAASLAIESLQLALSLAIGYAYRVADVDDVILNIVGALIGYAIFRAAAAVARVGAVTWPPR